MSALTQSHPFRDSPRSKGPKRARTDRASSRCQTGQSYILWSDIVVTTALKGGKCFMASARFSSVFRSAPLRAPLSAPAERHDVIGDARAQTGEDHLVDLEVTGRNRSTSTSLAGRLRAIVGITKHKTTQNNHNSTSCFRARGHLAGHLHTGHHRSPDRAP